MQQWDGRTWLGITPFQMAQVRAPLHVPIPGWGAFPELNVRAYVRTDDGYDGIWFLGMVVPPLSFVAAAGSLGLPYQRSASTVTIDGSSWEYRFGTPRRFQPGPDEAWFQASVTVGEPLVVNIAVLGDTGMVGSRVVAEAKSRGHHVTGYSRNGENSLDFAETEKVVDVINDPAPGERTGEYKVAKDHPAGSFISAEDFAVALIDEAENPQHSGTRFTVAN